MSPAESLTSSELLRPAERQGRKFLNPVPTRLAGLEILFEIGPEFFLQSKARSPQKPPGPFHTDPTIYAAPPQSGLRVTWMGHAASLLEIDGARILIDPVWDEYAAPMRFTGPKRFFPAPLALGDLPPLDAILISHDHYDHLAAGTVRALSRLSATAHARWITPLGVAAVLQRFGAPASRCIELNWMDGVTIGGVRITALPARHFSGRTPLNRFHTLWAAFAIAGARHRVYYGADSGEWPGFREIGERFGPFDLTMLEIGASDPLWTDIHMGPDGAVRSFRALGGHGLFMPIHWGLFDLARHYWTQPIEKVSAVEGLKLWSPTPGVPTEVIDGQELRSDWWR